MNIYLSFFSKGVLLKKMWSAQFSAVAPNDLKKCIAHYAPQFSGYNQHDSQELLAFLLDGLHEDLNRVRRRLSYFFLLSF